jgi:hypothetical protein
LSEETEDEITAHDLQEFHFFNQAGFWNHKNKTSFEKADRKFYRGDP